MIVRPPQSWFRLLFVWRGSVLPTILPQLLVMALLSCLAVFTHGRIFGEKIPLNTALLTLFGLTLALFLGFRNTASYQRFDEARHLWGQLLIASRSLASQLLCVAPDTRVADLLAALAHTLRHELRGSDPRADLARLLGPDEAEVLAGRCYISSALLHALRERISALPLPELRLLSVDQQLAELGRAVGGCERIASTPIPFAYGVLLHRTVYTYCALLPFGLVDATELFTPLLCVFVAYTLIAWEAIANEVSEPFGLAPNALALDAISRTIERSVFELFGRPLPEPVEARRYQLS